MTYTYAFLAFAKRLFASAEYQTKQNLPLRG